MKQYHWTLAPLLVVLASCSLELGSEAPVSDIEETAQQIGDVIASIDESSGSSGTFAYQKLFKRYQDSPMFNFIDAYAATCSFVGGFSTCTDGAITRTFNDCTIGNATFAGQVSFDFSQSDCSLGHMGDYVTRVPDFTVTGRRNSILHVEKVGSIGMRITRTNDSLPRTFSLSNDGIRRYFERDSEILFDYTTSSVNLFFTGNSRANRVISAGELTILDNLTEECCTFTPSNVSYDSSCNCAVAGSWSGTCGDDVTTTLTHTGCGTATFVKGEETQELTFDRCYEL